MRGDPGHGQLLGHIPPPSTAHQREVRVLAGGLEPRPQVLAVGRGDLLAFHRPGDCVQTVEGDLLPVDGGPAYEGLGTSSSSRGRQSARTRMLTQLVVTRLS